MRIHSIHAAAAGAMLGLALALGLAACIRTEIVPETLEPKLTVSPSAASLLVGETLQLTGVYVDAGGQDLSASVAWQGLAPGVVAVDGAGLVTALSVGQGWVRASAPGGLADSVLVTVASDPGMVGTVSISAAATALVVGQTLPLEAKVFNVAGAELPGQPLTWHTSNADVLAVDANGLATATGAGMAAVTAQAQGVSSLPLGITVTPVGGASRSGNFSGNLGYSVSGTATLVQEGSTLRLVLGSNFASSNGPGLFVYLAKNPSGALNAQNGLNLGSLQSTSGTQTYTVPASVSLQDFDYAVIYCMPFNVRFGTATLQ